MLTFSPPTTTEDNASIISNWVLTAEAVSLGGLSGTVHRFGIIDNVTFPNSKLEIISNVSKDENNLDGQVVTIDSK